MMSEVKILFFLVVLSILFLEGCNSKSSEADCLHTFDLYFEAESNWDMTKWNYTRDTVKVWYGRDDATPTLLYKDAPSDPWEEWDKALNATSSYDSLWYNANDHTVQGFFYKDNDFYRLLGASPNKTLRTYTFNEENKIADIRYQNIPEENTLSNKHMAPVYTWAQTYAPQELAVIFPNNKLVPSAENAKRWKTLLQMYRLHTGN